MQPTPAAGADKYHPPLPPRIPLQAVQSLIPRLTTTINDIDAFKALIASGNQDGSMPNWETLLHRYSLLLGRITALSSTISQLPSLPTTRPGVPRPAASTHPALSRYLIHPLNTLPSDANSIDPPLNPLAPDTFFQVLNTQLLPSISATQSDLLDPANPAGGSITGLGGEALVPLDRLKRMDEPVLLGVTKRLKDRLERESVRAKRLKELVSEKEGEVDWAMRIGEGHDDGEEEEEEDDLFGDGDEEKDWGEGDDVKLGPNPREGWSLADYVRYIDSGLGPAAPPDPPAQTSSS